MEEEEEVEEEERTSTNLSICFLLRTRAHKSRRRCSTSQFCESIHNGRLKLLLFSREMTREPVESSVRVR